MILWLKIEIINRNFKKSSFVKSLPSAVGASENSVVDAGISCSICSLMKIMDCSTVAETWSVGEVSISRLENSSVVPADVVVL